MNFFIKKITNKNLRRFDILKSYYNASIFKKKLTRNYLFEVHFMGKGYLQFSNI